MSDQRDEDLNVATSLPIAGAPVAAPRPRNAKTDLLSLLEVLEDAYHQGAIKGKGLYPHDSADAAGDRLLEAYQILRRWWP